MLFEKILQETKKLLAQYRDIPSLDKSRDMLIAKYGEQDFNAIRQQFAQKWLEDHGMWNKLPPVRVEAKNGLKPKNKKPKNKMTLTDYAVSKTKGTSKRQRKYEMKQSKTAQRIISPKPGPRVPHLNPDQVKRESITTHKSIHTLRG